MTRKNIQDKVCSSQAFKSYKSADDKQKERYYFSHDLNCNNNNKKIDPDSLFCHSAQALKIKQISDGLSALNYDLHILLVGTSLQPLMLSVSAINSVHILLLYASDGTEHKKDDLADYISAYKSIKSTSEPINSSEPYTVFSAIKKIIEKEEWQSKKICIDVTGGKKSMVSGGFLASSILDIDTYYIDFEEYQDGKPVIVTEFINKLDNPYDIYNIQLLNHAKALFENHRYDVAYDVFSQIEKKMNPKGKEGASLYGLEDEWQIVKKMREAASCYMCWDNFLYEEAENTVECLEERQKSQLSKLTEYQKIQDKKERYTSPLLYDFIIDRLLSAQRRWHENRSVKGKSEATIHGGYHDAMLRYFQCIEVMVDAYMTRNIKDSDCHPDDEMYRLSMKQKLKLCFNGTVRKKYKPNDQTDKGEGRKLVYELANTIKNKDLKEHIIDLNEHRNVFVHVKLENSQKDFILIERVVKELMGEVFYKENQEINQDLESLRFKRSFDEKGNMI